MEIKPELKGKPCAVVQYDTTGSLETVGMDNPARYVTTSRSGIIAVSYEARERGVKRNMTGQEARKICPDIQLVTVPTAHGKADLTLYRNAGARVVDVLGTGGLVERASVDEAYVDVTAEASRLLALACKDPKAWGHVVEDAGISKVAGLGDKAATALSRDLVRTGHCGVKAEALGPAEAATVWWGRPLHEWTKDERLLACGAAVVTRLRDMVTKKLGYTCSGGIAHNKSMAKLASGLHKPKQQTVVPASQVAGLMEGLPLERIRGLGGKLGEQVRSDLKVTTAGELAAMPEATLRRLYGEKQAALLADMARGVDLTPVVQRALSKSVSCGKTFYGNSCIRTEETLKRWLLELAAEIQERLDAQRADHKRAATRLTVHLTPEGSGGGGSGTYRNTSGNAISRSCDLREGAESMAADAFAQWRRRRRRRRRHRDTSSNAVSHCCDVRGGTESMAADTFAHVRGATIRRRCGAIRIIYLCGGGSSSGGTNSDTNDHAASRSCDLRERAQIMAADMFAQVSKWLSGQRSWGITSMFIAADGFEDIPNVPPSFEVEFYNMFPSMFIAADGFEDIPNVPPITSFFKARQKAAPSPCPPTPPPISGAPDDTVKGDAGREHGADEETSMSPRRRKRQRAHGADNGDAPHRDSAQRDDSSARHGGSAPHESGTAQHGDSARCGDDVQQGISDGGGVLSGGAAPAASAGAAAAQAGSDQRVCRLPAPLPPIKHEAESQALQPSPPTHSADIKPSPSSFEDMRRDFEQVSAAAVKPVDLCACMNFWHRLVDLPEDVRHDFEQRLEQLTRLSPPAGGIEQFLVKHTGAAPAPPLWYTAGQRAKPKGAAKKASKGSITQYLNGK
ncbi:hypothetical protein JKP88DRAFT_338079 [Tribonema minus]|uniref:DNA polymerase eta n=1 Tax=Tribonema minus TaxID=303371 RepID=A0A835YI13_9STRA|nr:hypothetical protein JKP88DRAFT_338079 [Tribonema minus]